MQTCTKWCHPKAQQASLWWATDRKSIEMKRLGRRQLYRSRKKIERARRARHPSGRKLRRPGRWRRHRRCWRCPGAGRQAESWQAGRQAHVVVNNGFHCTVVLASRRNLIRPVRGRPARRLDRPEIRKSFNGARACSGAGGFEDYSRLGCCCCCGCW